MNSLSPEINMNNNTSSERGAVRGLDNKAQDATSTTKGSSASALAGSGTQVSAVVRETASEAREQATTVADSAKDLASKASEKLMNSVEEQKAAGADFVSGMAGALRRAAHEFGEVPQAEQYIRLAANQIDSVSEAFRKRDVNQLVSDVQGFARRQPTAFLGMAVLAGFAAVRFLKTSTGTSAGSSTASSHDASSPAATGYRPGSAARTRM
jgi:gas vesicle protein